MMHLLQSSNRVALSFCNRRTYEGRRFSLIVRRSGDGRRNSLFARELDGTDIVSFNLFRVTSDRTLLKPCEMSAEKVVAFVLEFRPDT